MFLKSAAIFRIFSILSRKYYREERGQMVQKFSGIPVKARKRKYLERYYLTFFRKLFHRDEPFHLNSPRNYRKFHSNGKRSVTTDWLENQTLMLRSVPQMLKKRRIVVNKISKVRQNTCNWIKKILDEATRIVSLNFFLISWFFYLFLLCSISLLVKYPFILRHEAWVNL